MPVFSCDSGLYLWNHETGEMLPDEEQPGIHVRGRGEIRLSDDELIEIVRQVKKQREEGKYINDKVFREIVKNQIEIPAIKLYFTTDLRQNGESLSNTLIEFKMDPETNKYKMENVELKLLEM